MNIFNLKNTLYTRLSAEGKVESENWAGFKADGVEYLTHPVAVVVDKVLYRVEKGLINLHNAIMNSKPVVDAATCIIAGNVEAVLALKTVTRRTVRLYAKEGAHLSRKSDTRMTWYTSPITAVEVGEYMGHLTGRVVCVDLEIDITSDYSHRYYKMGDEAFILKGDLLNVAKRKWKYATETQISQSKNHAALLAEVAAGEV